MRCDTDVGETFLQESFSEERLQNSPVKEITNSTSGDNIVIIKDAKVESSTLSTEVETYRNDVNNDSDSNISFEEEALSGERRFSIVETEER